MYHSNKGTFQGLSNGLFSWRRKTKIHLGLVHTIPKEFENSGLFLWQGLH